MWNFLTRHRSNNSSPVPASDVPPAAAAPAAAPAALAPAPRSERPTAGKRDFCHKRLSKEFADLSTHSVPSIRLLTKNATQPPTTDSSPDQRSASGASSSSSSSSNIIPALLLGPTEPPPNFLIEWTVEITGAPNTLFAGEVFTLRFRFDERYPMSSPEVVFLGNPPIHPHIYSNGHICLSILYDGWSPALSVMAICLSLVSMLSSCEKKEKPPDDRQYMRICGPKVSPKSMHWVFHDDTV